MPLIQSAFKNDCVKYPMNERKENSPGAKLFDGLIVYRETINKTVQGKDLLLL